MTKADSTNASMEVLEDESLAWVNLLLSGAVTHDQAAAFQNWRSASPAHAEAFAEAMRFQRATRRAIEAERQDRANRTAASKSSWAYSGPATRRALLGGAIAASGAAYMVAQPPGHLWPSWSEFTSDYQTGLGEKRDIAIASGVSVELNTRTSITRRSINGGSGIELVSGEAVVTSHRPQDGPFTVVAGAGQALLTDGDVNVRAESAMVCVTCLKGAVRVVHPMGDLHLTPGKQAIYTSRRLDPPTDVDPGVAAAWRKGLLIFRDTPLQQVVDELNRYRPGRIVLVNTVLAHRPVYGVFQLRQISRAVRQVQALTGAKATHLPGGFVLLS